MQDAIILYENGKAIGGEGHPTDADDITFDNAGTDLVSENVENAIKEVNEKTKHGIVELWKNSNFDSAFAGQTITLQNFDFDKYDAIFIPISAIREAYGAKVYEFDKDILSQGAYTINLPEILLNTANSNFMFYYRPISFARDGNDLKVTFGDTGYFLVNSFGVAPTTSTDNTSMIPMRILGLIHND